MGSKVWGFLLALALTGSTAAAQDPRAVLQATVKAQGTNVNLQPAAAETRQLEIWLDPHGFLKGAMAAKDLVGFERWENNGERRDIIAYTTGKFRIQGSINDQNEVVRIQTFVPTPFL